LILEMMTVQSFKILIMCDKALNETIVFLLIAYIALALKDISSFQISFKILLLTIKFLSIRIIFKINYFHSATAYNYFI